MEKDIADILAFTDSNSMNVGIPRFLLTTKLLSILFKTDLKSTTGQAVIFKMRRILENVGHQADAKLAKGCSLISYSKFANASVDTVLWTAFEADLQKSGIVENSRRYSENYLRHREHYCSPLNQFVLANIQFLLAGLPFVAPDILAMTNPTNEELIGWNHMWAVLGKPFY
ncbi:unnamed protein product [Allacma fusca]|uniref:Uncharacterized protein n=1 Tax=Allacma fusca TaxID=39272 RepID=A0A8J2PYN9_9HEXA|nr:unnamed protein product [Allacma fusca]